MNKNGAQSQDGHRDRDRDKRTAQIFRAIKMGRKFLRPIFIEIKKN